MILPRGSTGDAVIDPNDARMFGHWDGTKEAKSPAPNKKPTL
jgi:hypothetical protein